MRQPTYQPWTRWGLHVARFGRTWYLPNAHPPWPLRTAEVLALEQRVGPCPGGAIARPDRAMPGGLDPERQPEDLDEPDGRGVVERIACVIRRQALVVQRQRRAPPGDDRLAVVQADPDLAGHDPGAAGGAHARLAGERRRKPRPDPHLPERVLSATGRMTALSLLSRPPLWRESRGVMLGYPDPTGLMALRKALSTHLRANRGVICAPEEIFIVSGAQDAWRRVVIDATDGPVSRHPEMDVEHPSIIELEELVIDPRLQAEQFDGDRDGPGGLLGDPLVLPLHLEPGDHVEHGVRPADGRGRLRWHHHHAGHGQQVGSRVRPHRQLARLQRDHAPAPRPVPGPQELACIHFKATGGAAVEHHLVAARVGSDEHRVVPARHAPGQQVLQHQYRATTCELGKQRFGRTFNDEWDAPGAAGGTDQFKLQAAFAAVDAPIELDRPDALPADAFFLTADILRVVSEPPAGGADGPARNFLKAWEDVNALAEDKTIQADTLTYAALGHYPPLLLRGGVVTILPATRRPDPCGSTNVS